MVSYHGGKQKLGRIIANEIYTESVAIADDECFIIKGYCEPFCGMLGVYQHIPELFKQYEKEEGVRLKYRAGDSNKSVILMWKGAQKGWKPPKRKVTAKEFLKLGKDGKSSADKGFIGHYNGYMGKYFIPFKKRKATEKIRNKIHNIVTKLKKVFFRNGKYTQFSKLRGHVIYCDPPYQVQSQYYTETGEKMSFDHKAFFDWCRKMSKYNIVFVTEDKAPKDFQKIWSYKVKGTRMVAKEKLYYV